MGFLNNFLNFNQLNFVLQYHLLVCLIDSFDSYEKSVRKVVKDGTITLLLLV